MTVFEIYNQFLNTEDTICVNPDLMRELTNLGAVVYATLQKKAQREYSPDGFYKWTAADLEDEANINPKTQTRLLKKMQDKGYIEVEQRGFPKSRYIKIIKKC